MIISHSHKFKLFSNGKTGTTSLEHALKGYQDGEDFDIACRGLFHRKHVPPALVRAMMPAKQWETYFKFVFVRNPWDWVVSNWKYNFENLPAKRRESDSMLRRAVHLTRGRSWRYNIQFRDSLSVPDIELLAKHLSAVKVLPTNKTCCQWPYVYDSDGEKLVDFVGHFESLTDDFRKVCERIKIDAKLPLLNDTKRSAYSGYFTSESAEAVRQIWKDDVELFDYSFDPAADPACANRG